MNIVDMLPQLDDKGLVNVFENATRLAASGTAKQQKDAAEAMPHIEAERVRRKALVRDAAVARAAARPPAAKKPSRAKVAAAEKAAAESA
jgi:hypothetical protein